MSTFYIFCITFCVAISVYGIVAEVAGKSVVADSNEFIPESIENITDTDTNIEIQDDNDTKTDNETDAGPYLTSNMTIIYYEDPDCYEWSWECVYTVLKEYAGYTAIAVMIFITFLLVIFGCLLHRNVANFDP